MPLDTLPLDLDFGPVPPRTAALFEAADRAAQAIADGDGRISSFVATAPRVGWAILDAARRQLPLAGDRFCEWGSGLGAVACMANLQGWVATGIEREARLLAAARRLAADQACTVRFVEGSYTPEGFHQRQVSTQDARREAGGVGLFDFDLVYAFAWPAEVEPLTAFFGVHAVPGTVMLLYRGGIKVTALRAR